MVIHLDTIIYLLIAIHIVGGVFCVALLSLGVWGLTKWLKGRKKRMERRSLSYYRLKPAVKPAG